MKNLKKMVEERSKCSQNGFFDMLNDLLGANAKRKHHYRPPRSRPQLVDGARGARNCVPKKVKVARGAVTPSAQMR